MVCPKCSAKLDWWSLLLRHFDWNWPSYTYAIVGGFTTSFMITMKPNEIYELDLEEVGIPKQSKILQTGYTPNGKGLFPVELHGNVPPRHFIPHKLHLFGRPFGEPTEETPVAVSICWTPKSDNNETWENIVSAVEAFTISDYNSCVIPANVAVEATLHDLMSDYFQKFAASDRVDDFLNNGATYSYQLNILLPMIANSIGFPKMPDFIRGNLNTLRSLRNSLAHKGKPKKIIDKKAISPLICSAAFGLAYLNLLNETKNQIQNSH
ncbi:Apea-like HEPN domain-containing protein [Flavobacterium longum]